MYRVFVCFGVAKEWLFIVLQEVLE